MGSKTDQLREKIKSKMEVAKFFSGFITLLIGFLLKDFGQQNAWSKAGLVFLVASLGYCIAAMFAYDRLLMPREYWENKNEKTDEEFFPDTLKNNMVRSWSWLFVPAVACFNIGLVLVLVSVLNLLDGRMDGWTVCINIQSIILIVLLTAALVSPIVLLTIKGPRIYD